MSLLNVLRVGRAKYPNQGIFRLEMMDNENVFCFATEDLDNGWTLFCINGNFKLDMEIKEYQFNREYIVRVK